MTQTRSVFTTNLIAGAVLAMCGSAVHASGKVFEVTITNITKSQIFTPIMVASHPRGVRLFEAGQPASEELEAMAEGGMTGPLAEWLHDNYGADVATTGEDVLPPGASVTLTVEAGHGHNYLSVGSMLVPSNDAFFAVNGMQGPRGRDVAMFHSPAYDAGSENNDELCVSIPGPPFLCNGEAVSDGGGEGHVHVHSGIHGIGDLDKATYDWRNPVAQISVRRVRAE